MVSVGTFVTVSIAGETYTGVIVARDVSTQMYYVKLQDGSYVWLYEQDFVVRRFA